MKTDISGRLRLPIALGAGGPATGTPFWRRWRHPRIAKPESKTDIGSWENEGGNLAPAAK